MASFTRPEDMAKVKGNCLIRSIGKGDVKVFWSLFDMAKVKGEFADSWATSYLVFYLGRRHCDCGCPATGSTCSSFQGLFDKINMIENHCWLG